jgi:hypothetical protein
VHRDAFVKATGEDVYGCLADVEATPTPAGRCVSSYRHRAGMTGLREKPVELQAGSVKAAR